MITIASYRQSLMSMWALATAHVAFDDGIDAQAVAFHDDSFYNPANPITGAPAYYSTQPTVQSSPGGARCTITTNSFSTTTGDGQADLCGSGGCNLYVLSLTPTGHCLVTSISFTRPPTCVLPSMTHGWHDLGVWVAGSGIIPAIDAKSGIIA